MRIARLAAQALVLLILTVVSPAFLRADVSLPNVIGSHMVLQRDKPLPIWGWAEVGEEVTVTLGESNTAKAKADDLGRWNVKLEPMKSGGGPLKLVVQGKNTIELTHILMGEVWVGSGQSNMQWAVSQSENAKEEISAATHPNIRLFYVPRVPSGTPANDVAASWTDCNPATAEGFSAVLYFYGRQLHQELDVPVGLIHTSWGGTRIEPWIPPAGFELEDDLKSELNIVTNANKQYDSVLRKNLTQIRPWLEQAEKAAAANQPIPNPPQFPTHPLNGSNSWTGLYNGMVHPLVPFAIRGAIWYQGESNRGQGMKYYTMMRGLVGGWRKVWNQNDEFPFYFVQLAPYRYGGSKTALAEIWEAQTASLAIPNTGMAVTTDIGNVADIHPKNKQEVGRRLALWALAKTYGKSDLVYSGPLYDSMKVELDRAAISFKHGAGLASRDKKALTWFTIAGEDRKFVPATATIEGDVVFVESPNVSNPVAVRFAWDDTAEPNLMNQAGLPASPFRTDSWDSDNPAFPKSE